MTRQSSRFLIALGVLLVLALAAQLFGSGLHNWFGKLHGR